MPEVQHGGHVRIATPGNTYVAMKAIPHLIVRFQGVPVQPSLRVNGTICAVNPRSGSSSAGEDPEDPVLNDEREATDPNEKGDLLDEVERFLDKDSGQDAEDGPDWMLEEGEMKSADPGYVFCTALTACRFSLSSQSISVSILFSPPGTARSPPRIFAAKLYMKCITSAFSADSGRRGATSGHPGTRRRCGNSGHDPHPPISPVSEPP